MTWMVEYLNRAVLKEAEALVPNQRARLQRIIELVEFMASSGHAATHENNLRSSLQPLFADLLRCRIYKTNGYEWRRRAKAGKRGRIG
jgi:hypothetical protein